MTGRVHEAARAGDGLLGRRADRARDAVGACEPAQAEARYSGLTRAVIVGSVRLVVPRAVTRTEVMRARTLTLPSVSSARWVGPARQRDHADAADEVRADADGVGAVRTDGRSSRSAVALGVGGDDGPGDDKDASRRGHAGDDRDLAGNPEALAVGHDATAAACPESDAAASRDGDCRLARAARARRRGCCLAVPLSAGATGGVGRIGMTSLPAVFGRVSSVLAGVAASLAARSMTAPSRRCPSRDHARSA